MKEEDDAPFMDVSRYPDSGARFRSRIHSSSHGMSV